MKFGTQMQIWNSMIVSKFLKFKMADGRHFKNRFWPLLDQQPISVNQNSITTEIRWHKL